jgi:hypothetical protein
MRAVRPPGLVIATASALACAVALAISSGAGARPTGTPCPDNSLTQPAGSYVSQAVTVPPGYDGDMFRPADTKAYPGKRPAIALMHGRGGSKCGLAWAARLLAAHGYVTLILTVPGTAAASDPFPSAILAVRRAVKYLRSPSNPFDQYIRDNKIGLAGHSLGAAAVSYVQGISPPVKAIVALDNLRAFTYGDPATPLDCTGTMSQPSGPRVPALGMAMDLPCQTDAGKTDKQYGFRAWRSAKQPAMELVMRGFVHTDFAGGGSDAKLKKVAYYTLAWFNRWLLNDQSQCAKLLSSHPLGIPIAQMLSARQALVGQPSKAFHSGAYLPGTIDSDDLVPYLQNHQQIC